MNYISNTINKTFKNKYHKDTLKIAINMAWPAIIESFFIAFAGLIDSLMVSSLGSASVAAVVVCAAEEAELLDSCLSLHPDSADSVRIPANRIESMDFPGRKFMI